MTVQKAEPTALNKLNDYYSLLSSYLGFDPNHQQEQQLQTRNLSIPVDFCIMPMKIMPSTLLQHEQLDDDIPDDLSGIFDDC